MDSRILAGLIIGAAIGTSGLIWESKSFTYPQKIFLLICIIFPPMQWASALVLYLFNIIVKDNKKPADNAIQQSTHFMNSTSNFEQKSEVLTKESTEHGAKYSFEFQKSESKISLEKQRNSLDELKRKGILSKAEYNEKSRLLFERIASEELKKLPEYNELLGLRISELLSEEQFNTKTLQLKKLCQEYFEKYGYSNFSKFNWNLFQAEKLNEEIDSFHYQPTLLIGRWQHKNGILSFRTDITKNRKGEEIRLRSFIMSFNIHTSRTGSWNLKNKTVHLKLSKVFGNENQDLEIVSLGTEILAYKQNGTTYKLYRIKN